MEQGLRRSEALRPSHQPGAMSGQQDAHAPLDRQPQYLGNASAKALIDQDPVCADLLGQQQDLKLARIQTEKKRFDGGNLSAG